MRAALDAYALTTVQFDNDERFEPNPRGLNGLFLTGQRLPKGTVVRVPYDEPLNGGPGSYELGEGSPEGRGCRPCTIRIAEINSLRRLILEGQKLNNCARTRAALAKGALGALLASRMCVHAPRCTAGAGSMRVEGAHE